MRAATKETQELIVPLRLLHPFWYCNYCDVVWFTEVIFDCVVALNCGVLFVFKGTLIVVIRKKKSWNAY